MEDLNIFLDYDAADGFKSAQKRAQDSKTRNFVLDFGTNEAQIAFDLEPHVLRNRINKEPRENAQCPVRWINIWAPNTQNEIVDLISKRYHFSTRLSAILQSQPRHLKRSSAEIRSVNDRLGDHVQGEYDLEQANGSSIQNEKISLTESPPEEENHYSIASHWTNYQSFDVGEEFLCIGANFFHRLSKSGDGHGHRKGGYVRVWTWLVLCHDHTVISLHEESKPENAEAVRRHTLTVLKQLSRLGFAQVAPTQMISVRQSLDSEGGGAEGASNLFYYLFEEWKTTYTLRTGFSKNLQHLGDDILTSLERRGSDMSSSIIIGKLYRTGKSLRTYLHLYEGYKNIVDRILEYRKGVPNPYGNQGRKHIQVAVRASERFERLRDRIDLLVINSLKELIEERDALISTYWSITTQKDSQATAKLSQDGAILSKLGVLFLPVSLMTSYFSVQIDDLQGVYSVKTYWACFAVVVALSFLSLFFFSRFLLDFWSWLENKARSTTRHFEKKKQATGSRDTRRDFSVSDDDEDTYVLDEVDGGDPVDGADDG